MCGSCGCETTEITVRRPGCPGDDEGHGHHHHHDHGHGHHHDHPHGADREARLIKVEVDILAKNQELAASNRALFAERRIVALNLVSSPGSGKTTLLEHTLRQLPATRPLAVIEGDQQTMRDAERIAATGVPVVQVNTGTGCHLDAAMVRRAVDKLALAQGSLLFIENVGNLVCPAMFDLGEQAKIVILSVTEGADKPMKYPAMFRAASLCILTKIDLLPYVDFDVEACKKFARGVNPDLQFFELSATRGTGMPEWLAWLGEVLPPAPAPKI